MFARRSPSEPRRSSGRGPRRAEAAAQPAQSLKQYLLRWFERYLRRRREVDEVHAAEPARGVHARRPDAAPPEASLPAPLLMLMQGQLASLLNHHSQARGTLPHLALLERVLRGRGEAAVWALPDPVLTRALAQLEALTDDWSQTGLAELRKRLLAAVRRHDAEQAEPMHDNLLSTFGTPDKMQISEVGLSVFEELDASWVRADASKPPR